MTGTNEQVDPIRKSSAQWFGRGVEAVLDPGLTPMMVVVETHRACLRNHMPLEYVQVAMASARSARERRS